MNTYVTSKMVCPSQLASVQLGPGRRISLLPVSKTTWNFWAGVPARISPNQSARLYEVRGMAFAGVEAGVELGGNADSGGAVFTCLRL